MEYHYPELCLPADHLHPDSYASEYVQPYMIQNQGEAEYEMRNSVLVDGGDRFGVSSVVFDKYEELVWMGNQGGHVTSYYGPGMQKYTSFQVHESEEVRDIITTEQGIFALTKSMLRHQIRRGIPKFSHKSSKMRDMQCLFQASQHRLLMGGHQDSLLDYDLNKMKESVIPIPEDGCAVLRSGGGSLVACGSAGGMVTLRDIRAPGESEHTFRAHSAALSDLDMQGDLLISCGFTDSSSGVAQAEPYVVVWDVRRLRGGGGGDGGAWSATTASVPLLLHFLPAFSGRAVAVAGDGHVTLLHVNLQSDSTENQSVFQVDTQNSTCTVMDVAASSQALVFGSQNGHIHLFSPRHNHEPVFNNFHRETEFATPLPTLPSVSFNDKSFQFSSVALPSLASGKKWLNELPAEFYKKSYRKPKPIDSEVLKSMKMQGPIGYAPNPKTMRRNQMPYIEDNLEDLNSPRNYDPRLSHPIPKQYQKIDLRVNKHNQEEMEIYNKTGFPGLESTLPNSYCNAMLQVLYYTAPVKSTLLAHTCAKEFCLSCELGFLFRMLDSSNGSACQASNFLRAFRTVPEAHALGLILADTQHEQRVDLVALIQSWNRFILHQIHYEIVETRKKEKALLAQNVNSPSKVNARTGNAQTSKIPLTSSPLPNGQFDEYNYSELEFLGPTEFDTNEDGLGVEDWQKIGQDEGAVPMTSEPDGMDLANKQNDREESEISQLFAIGRHQMNRCLKCNKEEERESVVLACALQYPTPSALKENGNSDSKASFIELLLASLSSKRSTPAWCENCRKFNPTLQQGRATRLPPILAINCGGVTAHEKAYWSKGTQKEMAEGAKRVVGAGVGKPCRYGLHCARPGCRFKHPDRPGAVSQQNPSSPSKDSPCVIPILLNIRLTDDGDIVINDKAESPTDPNQNKPESPKQKQNMRQSKSSQYHLSACVFCVEDNPKNLVAYVKTNNEQWGLFNDLSINPVPQEEVVHFGAWWKSPCVLFYTSDHVLTKTMQCATAS